MKAKKISNLLFRMMWLVALAIASLIHAVDGWVLKLSKEAYNKVYK